MKKIVSLMVTAFLAVQCLMAQVSEGIRHLDYEKYKSARTSLKAAYDANSKDPQVVYWYGQSLIVSEVGETPKPEDVNNAKAVYQKGIQDIPNDPMLVVGLAHIELLQGGDINSIKQKFEQAITTATETKGKFKGRVNSAVLNAIGRANASVGANQGDHVYAIEKLKLAAEQELAPADVFVNIGINYLRMGGENGGEAVKAFTEASARDPKNARSFYRIGKIYQSQNNKELFEEWFNKAIAADPNFPPVYYALYRYYADKDVNKAKDYLDKFVSNADKDPRNEILFADYLFRAGKYSESLAKLKELEAGLGIAQVPRIAVVYAYNYDRLGDSVQAKTYIQGFLDKAAEIDIQPADYELGVKVLTKFPGSEAQASAYIEKAISLDTVKQNKMAYMSTAADIFGRAKVYSEQLKWMKRQLEMKGSLTEADHYKLSNTAFSAGAFKETLDYARAYMVAFPDKPQPYGFFKRAALKSTTDTAQIVALLDELDAVYTKIGVDKYKKEVFVNAYFKLVYFVGAFNNLKKNPDFKVKSDGSRTAVVDQFLAICQKALNITDQMIVLYPDAADENNKFATEQRASIQKNIDYYSKPQGKPAAAPAKKG